MTSQFVPDEFEVPTGLRGPGFRLEPLEPEHNERDFEAWMSSIDHIRATPGFDHGGSWPVLADLQRNMEDLIEHARDFQERSGFTYTVLIDDEIVGCVYIYPSRRAEHDAEVRSWVRAGRAELDRPLWRAVSDWLESEWPFAAPYYAPRN